MSDNRDILSCTEQKIISTKDKNMQQEKLNNIQLRKTGAATLLQGRGEGWGVSYLG